MLFLPVHDATHRSYFSTENRAIVLDNVICTGEESILSQCSFSQSLSGTTSCTNIEHAGVRCGGNTFIVSTYSGIYWHHVSEPCMEGEVRLNDFYIPNTLEDYFRDPYDYDPVFIGEDKEELARGKVEICVSGGEWGTICEGESWNNSAASVACHQLGFSRLGMGLCTCVC